MPHVARRRAPELQPSLTLVDVDRDADDRRRLARALPTYEARPRRRRKILSYGGGLDSFAMAVDAVQRGEIPDLAIFADVSDPAHADPGEWPETYDHIRRVAAPYFERHGIPFKWLRTDESPIRGERSLFAYLRKNNMMVTRMSRLCTCAAKVERIVEYLEALYPEDVREVWIGFEAGEEGRAEKDPHAAKAGAQGAAQLRVNRFPLIERRLCRCRCLALVRNAGLEPPPGSACVFCPFSSRGDFQKLRDRLPGDFVSVQELEANAKRTRSGATLRYAGGAEDPELGEWINGAYRPMRLRCDVCGSPDRVRKMVGCGPEEMEAACPV